MTHQDDEPAACRFTSVGYRLVDNDDPAAAFRRSLRYWFRCDCGERGPLRSHENEAAEDGCDHAYPGWRNMPVMGDRPSFEPKELKQWEAAARAAYPRGWFERGGPVREYRNGGLSRHVPGYAPGGGHSMAVMRKARTAASSPMPTAAPSAEDVEQESLF
jgi:hypothetical protein